MHEIQLNISQKRIVFYSILVRTEKMQVAILHWLPGQVSQRLCDDVCLELQEQGQWLQAQFSLLIRES